MLLHQGGLGFERRTGLLAPFDAMRTALERSA
jgi:shikimate 5-dehydrogenase